MDLIGRLSQFNFIGMIRQSRVRRKIVKHNWTWHIRTWLSEINYSSTVGNEGEYYCYYVANWQHRGPDASNSKKWKSSSWFADECSPLDPAFLWRAYRNGRTRADEGMFTEYLSIYTYGRKQTVNTSRRKSVIEAHVYISYLYVS